MGPTTKKGNRAADAIFAALSARDILYYRPGGDGYRVDAIVVDPRDGTLQRCQFKNGRYQNGAVKFQASSTTPDRRVHRGYKGESDLFLVHCKVTGKVYVVPVDEVPEYQVNLRVEGSVNRQSAGTRAAAPYEIDAVFGPECDFDED